MLGLISYNPFCVAEKMISSEALEGVPILVLANKQDVEVMGGEGSPFY